MNPDPFQAFAELYELAKDAYPEEPNAAVLATVGQDGRPSARVVLLKGFSPEGFVFYTNLESRKGRELRAHPVAAAERSNQPIANGALLNSSAMTRLTAVYR